MTKENIIYVDEERVAALTLSVKFWGMVAQNPKTTPPTEKKVLETAGHFYVWLTT